MTENLPAIALTITATIGGALTTYLYEDEASVGWRLCAGACTGLGVLALVGFALASWLGLTPLVLVLAGLGAGSPICLLLDPKLRQATQASLTSTIRRVTRALSPPSVPATAPVLLTVPLALLLWRILDAVMFEKADGLYTGIVNNAGDLPFHVGIISRFALGGNFPPDNPIFAGVGFTYPFLSDFVAAMFVRGGATLRSALLTENFALAVSFVGLLYYWALDLTGDRRAALVTLALTLFSGGLGWWVLVEEAVRSPQGVMGTIAHLGHDYTISVGSEWRWGNIVTTLLVPQRSFLFGVPLVLLVFTQWWRAIRTPTQRVEPGAERAPGLAADTCGTTSRQIGTTASRRMIAAGVIAGMLPLVHAHSFVVVMGMAVCLALLLGSPRAWAVFFAMALALGLPQIAWTAYGSSVNASSFFGWHLGWDSGGRNVMWFWFKNTGLFIPLTAAAFLLRGKNKLPRDLRLFYLPFTLCFLIPNVIQLAPWVWDNIKVLIYWHLASAPLVALVLTRLWRGPWWHRAISMAMLGSLTLAGGLDIWRVVSHAGELRVFSREGIRFAAVVGDKTLPHSLILHAPTYNHPVLLTGRRSFMGYPGHLWTHGLDYRPREADVRRIYAGGDGADVLLARYGIDFVVLGPLERRLMPTNDQFFDRFTQVGAIDEFRLYRVAAADR
jgi:hypothetical protein